MYYISNFSFIEKVKPLLYLSLNDILEIIIMIMLSYLIIRYFKGTRIWSMAKGLIIIVCMFCISYLLSLKVLTSIFNVVFIALAFTMLIMFQPELKKILEQLGTKGFSFFKIEKSERDDSCYSENTINEIVDACLDMSQNKTGALILIERNSPLNIYVESGILLDGIISKELLINIFEKNTPLHDGAVVIQKNIIKAATCYLPISNRNDINKNLGTRHRAAIGASEETDAVVIVVSEETGKISIIINGEVIPIRSKAEFKQILNREKDGSIVLKKKDLNYKQMITAILSSVFVGLFAWLIITDITDPIVTITYTAVPVELENTEKLEDTGYIYDIKDGDTITVYATGKKSKIAKLSLDNITAKADVSTLSITNSASVKVTSNIAGITFDTRNALVTLAIDEENSVDCTVEVKKTGNEKDGYYIAELVPEYKTITVTGAKNKVKTIDKALITVDVENKYKDINNIYEYTVYDKNGNVFDLSECNVSCEKIKVKAKVYKTKEVDIKISAYDSANENCNVLVTSSYPNMKKLLIAGPEEVLQSINEIEISFDISANKTKNISLTADVENYIPEGCFYAGKIKELEVRFSVDKQITTTISIESKDVKVNGNRNLEDKTYNIVIEYDPFKTEPPDAAMLHPYVEISDIKNNKVPLKFSPEYDIVVKSTCDVNVSE